MPKAENQKQKLLYIIQYLMENTDVNHAVSTPQLIEYLNSNGIKAERKSIYNDIETLNDFGYDIIRSSGPRGGYMLASRDFELAEVKLLIDLVQSSKFISEKNSRELIEKLEKLASKHEAKGMQRQVQIIGRSKSSNEKIYYNVDAIHTAISQNVKIRFHYFEWNGNKNKHIRKGGEFYEVSPYKLTWDDENYYLIAYDDQANLMKHYRVDKMLDVEVTEEERTGKAVSDDINYAEFSKRTFGMFAGEERMVRLLCENGMMGTIIDKFGEDIPARKVDDTHFMTHMNVSVSPQFFGWLAGLGTKVKIESPEDIAAEYKQYLVDIIGGYK